MARRPVAGRVTKPGRRRATHRPGRARRRMVVPVDPEAAAGVDASHVAGQAIARVQAAHQATSRSAKVSTSPSRGWSPKRLANSAAGNSLTSGRVAPWLRYETSGSTKNSYASNASSATFAYCPRVPPLSKEAISMSARRRQPRAARSVLELRPVAEQLLSEYTSPCGHCRLP
jgi:hypothetical protein